MAKFTVKLSPDFKDAEVQIINTIGEIVFKKNLSKRLTTLDLSQVDAGVYTLLIKGNSRSYTHRIVKDY